jgi:integrase/recombinase XerD
LRRYRLHLVASGAGVPTISHSLTALRFLFLVTLRKPAIVLDMPFVREPRRLPVVLSRRRWRVCSMRHRASSTRRR